MTDLDDLLDTTLDDLEDLPEFKPFCAGAYKALASFEEKEVNGDKSVELRFKLVEVLEVPDDVEESEHPKEGDESSVLFKLNNEYGRGNLKKLSAPFAEALQLSTIRDVVDGVKDVEVAITTGAPRKDKENPDRSYLNVQEIIVL